jgi:hypothetical protein
MKRFLILICLLLACNLLFAEDPKGQIMRFNEEADEEIIVINNSGKSEAFKIWCHTTDRNLFSFKDVDVKIAEAGWIFLTKTPLIESTKKWKSTSDYDALENADKLCIESKSGNKYNYYFEAKHDKLYITVTRYSEHDSSDDW